MSFSTYRRFHETLTFYNMFTLLVNYHLLVHVFQSPSNLNTPCRPRHPSRTVRDRTSSPFRGTSSTRLPFPRRSLPEVPGRKIVLESPVGPDTTLRPMSSLLDQPCRTPDLPSGGKNLESGYVSPRIPVLGRPEEGPGLNDVRFDHVDQMVP